MSSELETDAVSSTACNGTIVNDTEMGEVIQLQGDQRKDVQEFLVNKREGLGLDGKDIKVYASLRTLRTDPNENHRSTVSKPCKPRLSLRPRLAN